MCLLDSMQREAEGKGSLEGDYFTKVDDGSDTTKEGGGNSVDGFICCQATDHELRLLPGPPY